MYCGSMLVYDSDASSKKTIYTYITVSRNTQPAESRIYDEIPPHKVRCCYSQVSTTTPRTGNHGQQPQPRGWGCGIRPRNTMSGKWSFESSHGDKKVGKCRPPGASRTWDLMPGFGLDVRTKSKSLSIGYSYQGSLWQEVRAFMWPLTGKQVAKGISRAQNWESSTWTRLLGLAAAAAYPPWADSLCPTGLPSHLPFTCLPIPYLHREPGFLMVSPSLCFHHPALLKSPRREREIEVCLVYPALHLDQ